MTILSNWTRLLAIVLATLAAVLVGASAFRLTSATADSALVGASLAVAAAVLVTALLVRVDSVPDSVTISVVGPSRVGKTVFISVSLDLFMTSPEGDSIRLVPYGAETAEAVDSVVAQIRSGAWPPKTPSGKWFEYKARVSLRKGVWRRRSPPKLNVGDFPGEDIDQFVPGTPKWFHKSTAFRYVIDSDAVFFVVDAGLLVGSTSAQLAHSDATFKAALQVIYDEKVGSQAKLILPIGIILAKSDLLPGATKAADVGREAESSYGESVERQLIALFDEKLAGFSALLKNLCQTKAFFAVSAVGYVRRDGRPPEQLKPVGIRAPWEWALRELLPDIPKE
jgi:hypothetical protein